MAAIAQVTSVGFEALAFPTEVSMRPASTRLLLAALILILAPAAILNAQVTTSTLIGLVKDSSGAILPGASVVATNEGTGVSREATSDSNGEFVLTALPSGPYTVKIDMTGFKAYLSKGLQLGAGQTVRQNFALELGTVAETVTVTGQAPVIETSSSTQVSGLGSQEVRELPINRRNVTNLLALAPGVTTSGSGSVQMNGVAAGGTGVTVDGTEANSNPEARSLSQYGGQNQIDVMSIEAVSEVQIVKGVLPAEYGGVTGGQVNMISRSGTNAFHGSAFENTQSDKFFARDPFLPNTVAKPSTSFNQYGGSLGGPIMKNKVFFFTTYEGYHENAGVSLTAVVPYPATTAALLAALPFPETKIVLATEPAATEPVVATNGTVDPNVGRYRGTGQRIRRENHVVAKGDVALFNGANLAVTYTRLRPFTLSPAAFLNKSNDRTFPNQQDRVAMQFVATRGRWVSESRFGYNHTYLARLDAFFNVFSPSNPAETLAYGKRVGLITISGLFATPSSELYNLTGGALSYDQKFSHAVDRHLLKVGFRWQRQTGNREDPQNPNFTYQSLADALANIPSSVNMSFGAPPHKSHLDEFGGFIQDDWRLGAGLVLNLGLRYDYYPSIKVYPTTSTPVEIVNLAQLTDLRKLDFGGYVDPLHPYKNDGNNIGPRLGFAWTVPNMKDTVIRGGSGVLYSPHLPATVRESAANPFVPFRQIYNRTQAIALGLQWPLYNDDVAPIVVSQAGGKKTVFSVLNTDLPNPYTIQSMISVERGFGRSIGVEVGYVHTDGQDFPLQDPFPADFDRATGAVPNPAIGAPGGYYVTSGQTMAYNALQTSFRKRFSNHYSLDVSYALAKGMATQGGDLAAYYLASVGNTQDFFNPEADRAPVDNDIRHRTTISTIYELPTFGGGKGLLNHVAGNWQISSIIAIQTGTALSIAQASGITQSRADIVPGVNPIVANWEHTNVYLNTAAFVRVPVSTVTQATLRPGTYIPGMVRGPGLHTVNLTLAKNFPIGGRTKLQVRIDGFNVLNTKNLSNPVTGITASNFGVITAAGTPRTAQVGARLTF